MKIKFLGVIIALLFGVMCNYSAENRIILKPGSEGADKWYGTFYNQQGVDNDILRVGGWGDYYYSLIKFNGVTQSLPGPFVRAELWLYHVNTTRPTNMKTWLLTSMWSEAQWDHANLMGYYLGIYPGPVTGSGWYGLNVTSSINYWRQNPTSNFGWFFAPEANDNRFDEFYSSDSPLADFRPQLHLVYDGPSVPLTPTPTDNRLKLKWPLGTAYAGRVIRLAFKDQSPIVCSSGINKQHNGIDYSATAGTAVYAAENGVVKEVIYDSTGKWAYNIVVEHNHPSGGKCTSVSWHVNPSVSVGSPVTKGMQIATVAYLTNNTHFHFGLRMGTYVAGVSGLGALPYASSPCDGYPVFPADFFDPADTNKVSFQ